MSLLALTSSQDVKIGEFLYTCFEMGERSQVVKWIPIQEPVILSYIDGTKTETVQCNCQNNRGWAIGIFRLELIGITNNEPINRSLTFSNKDTAESYLRACINKPLDISVAFNTLRGI